VRVENTSDAPSREEGRIRALPDALVDQIAAGEVVERPASVVKELVENALDAEATRIRVEVREGGSSLISVTDDGLGMTPGEARLALRRHATSKLSTADDLMRIASFGFRGEALPAIASVSRMRLLTRARGAAEAHEIRIDAGRVALEQTAGGPEGTRIEVADLFASVPARRKFLKKPGTEWGHIADWLGRLALALPGIHFEVQRDDRSAIVWPSTDDPLTRIAAVLSEREAEGLVPIEREEEAGHVQAFVSSPDHTRGNANGLYLFVNGRPVRDKLLRHAVLEAYRDVLPRGRYPTAIVFVTVAPERVDVNVHPAKWEVRFVESQAVHRLVRHAIRDAMSGRSWLAGEGAGPAAAALDRAGSPTPATAAIPFSAAQAGSGDWLLADAAESPVPPSAMPFQTPRPLIPAMPGSGEAEPRLHFGSLRLLGQMKASYLILEGPQGMLLVDQHAAHERVLYERLRSGWLAHGVERQGLLVPLTIELDAVAIAALSESSETVEQLGFEVDPFGENAVVVRAVPALLGDRDPAALVRELALELAERDFSPEASADRTRILPVVDRIFATLACHSARRFGDHLERGEQQALLRELDTIPWAPTCPHGRPVAIGMNVAEIEHRFGRR
jgi:DNA mismatch repair protein MutL